MKSDMYICPIIVLAILKEAEPDTSAKDLDICQVVNANREQANFDVAKGLVAHMSPDVSNGSELIKRMNEYADAGIAILQADYERSDGEIGLDMYID